MHAIHSSNVSTAEQDPTICVTSNSKPNCSVNRAMKPNRSVRNYIVIKEHTAVFKVIMPVCDLLSLNIAVFHTPYGFSTSIIAGYKETILNPIVKVY